LRSVCSANQTTACRHGSPTLSTRSASRARSTRTRPTCLAASSSESRLRARWCMLRDSSSPTSRQGTSTRRRRGRSCSSFCASTRAAPPWSWRRTTARSSTFCAAASSPSTRDRLQEMTDQAGITKMFRNLKFALNSAWQSFWRNLAVSLAAVVSITLILILAGVNLLVGHAFSQVLDGFKDKVSDMSINVADDTPLQSVYAFRDQLAADPRVASVKFVTKAEALSQFEQDPNNYAL